MFFSSSFVPDGVGVWNLICFSQSEHSIDFPPPWNKYESKVCLMRGPADLFVARSKNNPIPPTFAASVKDTPWVYTVREMRGAAWEKDSQVLFFFIFSTWMVPNDRIIYTLNLSNESSTGSVFECKNITPAYRSRQTCEFPLAFFFFS